MKQDKRQLMWFLYCELFHLDMGAHWGTHMTSIVKKYGCVVNALKAHRLYWLFCIIDDWDNLKSRVTFPIHMWLRKHYFHNL